MTPVNDEQPSWGEYRLLFKQEMEDNRKFREETRESLNQLHTALTEIKVERKVAKWVLGVGLPAAVAAAVTGAAKALGL